MKDRRSAYRVLMGRPEGKRQFGRPRRRWEGNMTMDLQEVVFGVWAGSIGVRIETDC
jgi:hypothetical protein